MIDSEAFILGLVSNITVSRYIKTIYCKSFNKITEIVPISEDIDTIQCKITEIVPISEDILII